MNGDWSDDFHNGHGIRLTSLSSPAISGVAHSDHGIPRPSFSTDRTADQYLIPRKPTLQIRDGFETAPLPANQPQRKSVQLHWRKEIGAVLLSAIAFLAVIVTLYPHNGKPLPQWPHAISINALLSIYILVFKASVLFVTTEGLGQLKWIWFREPHTLRDLVRYDEASRGVQGAIKLIWTLRAHDVLASCGALVMFLNIFVDPFTQQILHYYDCNVPFSRSQATIQRTNFLASLGPSSIHVGADLVSVPPDWQDAANAGIFSPGQQVAFSCLTGNCTFAQYSTVAYCCSCEDVSDSLTIVNHTWSTHDSATNYTADYWGFLTSLPSGTSILSAEERDGIVNYTAMASPDAQMEIIMGKTPGDLINLAFGTPEDCSGKGSTNDSWRCRGYGAARCSLFPCVRTYNSTIALGILQETLVDSSPNDQWGAGESPWLFTVSSLDVDCLSSLERQRLEKTGYQIGNGQRWLAYNVTWDLGLQVKKDAPFPQSMLANGCLYAYDYTSASSLWAEYLSDYFFGQLYGYFGAEIDPTFLVGPENLKTIFDYGNISFDRVNGIFQNISDSFATLTRQTGDGNQSVPAVGTVMHAQTCLEVRWGWLAFLAVTSLVAWMFFFATVVAQSRQEGLPLWKSSILPILFHGLVDPDRHTQTEKLNTGDMDGMSELAGDLKVRLGRGNEGLKLFEID